MSGEQVDIATLGLRVDASGVVQSTDALDKFTAASEKAEDASEKFVAQAERTRATLGKSRAEVMAYDASKMKLTATQQRNMAETIKAIDAFDKNEKAIAKMKEQAKWAGLALVALAAGYAMVIKASIDFADKLDELAEKTGISASRLSEYSFIANQSDTSLQALSDSMKFLAKNMADAAAGQGEAVFAFKAMGVAVTDSRGRLKDYDSMLKELADKFASYKDGPEKAALAQQIFGRSAQELLPLLNKGSAGFEELRQRAIELGLTVSDETAASMGALNDRFNELQQVARANTLQLAAGVQPALMQVSDAFLKGANQGEKFKAVGEALGNVFKVLASVFSGALTILELVGNRIGAIAAAVVAFFSGDFAGSKAIMRAADEEAKAIVERGGERIATMWRETGAAAETAGATITKSVNAPIVSTQDETRKLTKLLAEYVKGVEELVKEQEKLDDQFSGMIVSLSELGKEAEWQRSIAHLTSEEQSRLTALRQIDLAVAEAMTGLTEDQIAALIVQRDIAKEQVDATARTMANMAALRDAMAGAWDQPRADLESMLLLGDRLGTVLEGSFKKAGGALNALIGSLGNFAARQHEINERNTQAALKAWNTGDVKAYHAAIQKANEESARSTAQMYGDMAGAAKGFFDEGTKGYKIMEAVERGFRMMEMALSAQSYIQQMTQIIGIKNAQESANGDMLTSLVNYVTQAIGLRQAEGQANAVAGVANQANGDPYSAFFRMAAMAAIMAALGFATGGVGGGGGQPPEPGSVRRQREQGTGTVLGDSEEKSESILNALEILRDNSSDELLYQSRMLSSLLNIESSMSGMAAAVARARLNGDRVQLPQDEGSSWFGLSGGNTFSLDDAGIILGRILQQNSSDPGQRYGGQSVGELIRNASAVGFTDIRRDHSGFRSYSAVNREHQSLEDGLIRDIGRTIGAMRTAVAEAVVILTNGAVGFQQVTAMLDAIDIEATTISFADLAGGEIQEALMQVFSSIGDTMVTGILSSTGLEVLADFQRVGEGAFETLIRVASGIESARAQLDQWGIDMIAWQDIANKQGDVTVELLRDSIVRNEGGSGVGQIIQGFDGSADELVALFNKLEAIRVLLRAVGQDGQNLNQAMIAAAGGVENFLSALDTYFNEFFTPQERRAAKTAELQREWGQLQDKFEELSGVTLPTTRQGFRALIESIDKDSPLYGALIALVPMFAEVTDAMNGAASAAAAVHEAYFADQGSLLGDLLGKFEESIGGAVGGQGSLSDKLTLRTTAAADQIELWQARMREVEAQFQGFMMPPEWFALRDAIRKVTAEQKTLAADLGKLAILTAQYGEAKAEELFELDKWYDAQKKLAGNNQAVLLALEKLYGDRRVAILEGASEAGIGALESLRKSIGQWRESLLLSNFSPLTATERMDEAMAQYQKTLALAQANDPDALREYQKIANAVLQEGVGFWGRASEEFQALFQQIRNDSLGLELGETSAPTSGDIHQVRDAIIEENAKLRAQVSTLTQRVGDLINAVNNGAAKTSAAMATATPTGTVAPSLA
jgi:regulator of replication initiation timing